LVANSTITGNRVEYGAYGGGGLGWLGLIMPLNLQSNIIAANKADYSPDLLLDSLGKVTVDNNVIGIASGGPSVPSGLGHQIGSAQLPLDPGLAPLADNGGPTWTHALLPNSPALNRGNNASSLATDQRGFARVFGPAPDVGAFESASLIPAANAAAANVYQP